MKIRCNEIVTPAGAVSYTHLDVYKRQLLSIPVHCQVPAFSRRPVQEREELVIQLLLKEQRKLNREIKMSARLFGALCADLPGLNLAELNNGLKTMCAAAYSQHPQEPVIVLKAMDLPPELLGRLPLSLSLIHI